MDFTLILLAILIFAAGTFLGVLLGRRSARANEFVDDTQAKADRLRDKMDRW